MGGKGALQCGAVVEGGMERTEAPGVAENTTWMQFVRESVTCFTFSFPHLSSKTDFPTDNTSSLGPPKPLGEVSCPPHVVCTNAGMWEWALGNWG